MIEFTETEAYGFQHAIRGMRNSWGSHEKSDSGKVYHNGVPIDWKIGPNDHALAMKLSKVGGSHGKFLRQIEVWVDINAPLYWWKEMDQYKFIVTNSESTMHTIQRKEFTPELFSLDEIPEDAGFIIEHDGIEFLRKKFLETKDKRYWKLLIQLLPSGWMQKRTTKLNYQTIKGAYHDRKGHRLSEWEDFRKWAESLPYSELITGR